MGLAITQVFLLMYPSATIYATFRSRIPNLSDKRLSWLKLDATKEDDIQQLASEFTEVDILVNAIGVLHDDDHRPEKSLREFNLEFFRKNIEINTVASILLAKHFSKLLRHSNPTFFISLSAKVGSIEDNKLGGWISYRCSKAALNMALKTISIEWQRTVPNCCVVVFHPGTNDTPLSQPFQRNVPKGKLHTPEFTANALMDIINSLTPAESGGFYAYDGTKIPW